MLALKALAGRLRLAPELRQVVNNSEMLTERARDPARVPAVYPTHAFLAFLELAALREMNNLRVCSGLDGSIPTRASNKSSMFMRVCVALPIQINRVR